MGRRHKQLIQDGKDLLTLCLAKAIDDALTEKVGPEWFAEFLQHDKTMDEGHQIARNGQNSIRDLDMQALLKILRHRNNYSTMVLNHYHFLNQDDPYDLQTKQRQIRQLLDRLITDFRNQIEAHNRVADIERSMNNEQENRLYGYQEALDDMAKLAGIFHTVRGSDGRSYHKQLLRLAEKPRHWRRIRTLALAGGGAVALVAVVVAIVLSLSPSIPKYTPKTPTMGNVYYNPAEPTGRVNEVTVTPIHVYYEGNTIVAQCYVHNAMSGKAKNINIRELTLSDNKGVICSASFGELTNATIRRNSAIIWTFVFTSDTVLRHDGDLPSITAKNVQYIISCNE